MLVEQRACLAEAADQVLALNGYAGVCSILNRDARRLRVPEDLPSHADVIMAEVRRLPRLPR